MDVYGVLDDDFPAFALPERRPQDLTLDTTGRNSAFCSDIAHAEWHARALMSQLMPSSSMLNRALQNEYTAFCLFWMLGLVADMDKIPELCPGGCGCKYVIRRKEDSASKVRFECHGKCSTRHNYTPKLKAPLSTNLYRDSSWAEKVRMLWGMSHNKGPVDIRGENSTVWAPTADPELVSAFYEAYPRECGCTNDRHTIGKFLRSVKEAIAWARFWDFFVCKLTGGLECDETHSTTGHASTAWHRMPAGLFLELLGIRESNQGGDEREAWKRRTIWCAMVPAEDDGRGEESRSDRIIRYVSSIRIMSMGVYVYTCLYTCVYVYAVVYWTCA